MKVKREMIIIGCMSVLSIVFVISCEDHNHIIDGKAYNVSGRVTDSVTTLAIDSVLVSWGDTLVPERNVYTDSNGSYILGVPQGTHIIYARKAGYKTKSREIKNLGSDVSNFNFELVTE